MTQNYPPPIFSTEPGSWAHSTILVRLPKIAQRVIDENQYPPEIVENITRLQNEIKNGRIRYLLDDGGPDLAAWQAYIKPYLGKNWLVIPWLLAEHYFYRRIMEAVDYFSTNADPFRYQKEQGLIKRRLLTSYSGFPRWERSRVLAKVYMWVFEVNLLFKCFKNLKPVYKMLTQT